MKVYTKNFKGVHSGQEYLIDCETYHIILSRDTREDRHGNEYYEYVCVVRIPERPERNDGYVTFREIVLPHEKLAQAVAFIREQYIILSIENINTGDVIEFAQ